MRRFVILLLILTMPVRAMGATLPSYSPKFGNAMAGVIQQKVAARGFSANDPRFIATETAIGAALTAAAGGLAAAAGAPLWATVAIGAVTAGAVSLGINALTKWLFNSDGTVTNPTPTIPPVGAAIAGGMLVFGGMYGNTMHYSSDAVAFFKDMVYTNYGSGYASITFSPLGGCTGAGYDQAVCLVAYGVSSGGTQYQLTYSQGMNRAATVPSGTPSCSTGFIAGSNCTNPSYAVAPTPVPQAPSAAVANVPDSDMALAANPQLLAQAANKWWQQAAAQPNYQGLPYVASDPITAQDVSSWQAANPSTYPTVSDMLAPAVNPATSTVAQPVAPGTVASPGIQTGASGQPAINLGTDPVVPLPTLEATPTAQMILNPLLNLFPDLKSFVVPSHSAECPKPSMSLFGRTTVLDGHCTLLDSVRPTLYAVMAAVWLCIALFIILAA